MSMSRTSVLMAAAVVAVAVAVLGQARLAGAVTYHWNVNSSGNWSDITKWADGVPADGSGNVARFNLFNANRTVTLDSNRTISEVWYNDSDGSGSNQGNTPSSNCSITIGGGNTLTLAGGTPSIYIGRLRQDAGYPNAGDSVIINAILAGTAGVKINSTPSYTQSGVTLGGANTISGTVYGYKVLGLKNLLALQNATIRLTGSSTAGTLRLYDDADGATFLTAGLTQTGTGGPATIYVDQKSTGGGTGHVLKLAGNYTGATTGGTKSINVTGANGYSLELTGTVTNNTLPMTVNANSANVKLSGALVDLGSGGLVVGGTLATGENEITGEIHGAGGLTKSGTSTWILSGDNTYAGTTTISGGKLLIDGSTTDQGNYLFGTLSAEATLGGAGTIGLASNSSLTVAGTSGAAQAVVKPSFALDPLIVKTSGSGATVIGNYGVLDIALTGDTIALLRVGSLNLASTSDKIRITASGTQTRNRYVFCTYSGTLTGTFTLTQFTGLPGSAWIDYSTPGQIAVVLAAGPALVAFPGAEGFGADAVGGRGGAVIEVTNLNNTGTGSLRAACSASGARTIVFRVSGNIELTSDINITQPYCTIAGQTSPGGICVTGGWGMIVKTHNVVIRGMRYRTGDLYIYPFPPGKDPDNRDSFGVGTGSGAAQHVIFDRCSFSWAIDDNVDTWYPVDYVTFQNCIFSEPLWNAGHPKGAHGFNFLIGDHAKRVSVHHNLLMHANDRSPGIKQDCTGTFINNVVYNWGWVAMDFFKESSATEAMTFDVVGNLFIPGLDTSSNKGIYFRTGSSGPTATSRFFLYGNIGPGRSDSSQPEWNAAGGGNNPDWHATSLVMGLAGVTLHKADDDLLNHVLANAGATVPRDSVDQRLVGQVIAGTGEYIDSQEQVGGWPDLSAGAAPTDTDHDGMPDAWETAMGLNPNLASDRNGDLDGDGYTNLEEYLASLFE
ncbi:MAG: autotransporter-associated beta strand repeat-containing protein [Phycisphaeraceae bacterium]